MSEQTYFDKLKRNFSAVSIQENKGIDTSQFLEACEGVVGLFELFGSKAFGVVQSDISGNVKKINDKYQTNKQSYTTLQNIVLDEAGTPKKRPTTEGLLWLKRGLEFTVTALKRSLENPAEELDVSFTKAYEATLKQYHSFVVRPIFTVAMKACPYRKDLMAKLGSDQAKVNEQYREWTAGLENVVSILNNFFAEGKHDQGF